jgi:integrase
LYAPQDEAPAEVSQPPSRGKPSFDEFTLSLIERLGLVADDLPVDVSPAVTWPEHFVLWHWPVVMRARKNATSTIDKMVAALRWWRRLTSDPKLGWEDDLALANDPPIGWTDEHTLVAFQHGLRSAVWRRGKLGVWEPLSEFTTTGHLVRMQELIERAGPTCDRKRPCKGLYEQPLVFDIKRRRCKALPPFTIDEARAIVAAAVALPPPRARRPRKRPVYLTPQACRTFFGLKFVTGLRVSSVLLLRWEWFEDRTGLLWLEIPDDAVLKTGKGDRFTLPEWLTSHLSVFRRSSGPLFPEELRQDAIDKMHRRAQRGIVRGQPMGFNAWRRTMSHQLALLGAEAARQASQLGLNHGSSQTTNDSYCDVDNLFRPRLPALWDGPIGVRQSLLF